MAVGVASGDDEVGLDEKRSPDYGIVCGIVVLDGGGDLDSVQAQACRDSFQALQVLFSLRIVEIQQRLFICCLCVDVDRGFDRMEKLYMGTASVRKPRGFGACGSSFLYDHRETRPLFGGTSRLQIAIEAHRDDSQVQTVARRGADIVSNDRCEAVSHQRA